MINRQVNSKFAFTLIIILAAIVAGYTLCEYKSLTYSIFSRIFCCSTHPPTAPPSQVEEVASFTSEEDFKNYLEKAALENYGYGTFSGGLGRAFIEEAEMGMSLPLAAPDGKGGGAPERISETTVQVRGIDEPDIVKTDGKEIYFSSTGGNYWRWGFGQELVIPNWIKGKTNWYDNR